MSIWTFEADHTWRLLPLEGANNFRDIGGWQTSDGRMVASGRVYRAATLQDLSVTDTDRLADMGFTDVVDLRGVGERAKHPSRWPAKVRFSIWEDAGEEAQGDLARVMAEPNPTADAFRDALVHVYTHLPFSLAAGYRHILMTLAEGRGPLLFHCAAGKDRTGVASAILLTALGVEREQVRLDYLLTNQTFRITQARFERNYNFDAFEKKAPGAIEMIFGAHDAYLDTAFFAIEQRHGTFEAYLRDGLGVDDKTQARLKAQLLVD